MISSDPFSGKVVHNGPGLSPESVADEVRIAESAFASWSQTPLSRRQEILHEFADLIEASADRLTDLIVAEMGKVRAQAVQEVHYTAYSARWYADHPPGEERQGAALVRRRPLGVVAAITPWNVPLLTSAWKWLPALIAGNTVVWKPSELTPANAVAAVELLREAGLPEDVLRLALGDREVGEALCADPQVASVHFTGSTATGLAIHAAMAGRLVPCALEMGGLNPAVIFADADLEHAADCVVAAATAINGQKCTATRRVIAHESVADEVIEALRDRLGGVRPGDPRSGDTDLGPLVTAEAATAAAAAVESAERRGARVLARSPAHPGDTFFPATLLTGLAPGDPLRDHELFAPVVSIDTFKVTEDAWAQANRPSYGLSAAVYTRDPQTAASAPHRLRTGVVAVNRRGDAVDIEAPFGGVKASGNGHPEGGRYVYSALTTLQACYHGQT